MYQSIEETQKALASGIVNCIELVEYYLNRIEQNKALNIYLEVFQKDALQRAKQLDEKRQRGEALGKLYGVVVAIKDVICYKGHEVTAASKILKGFVSVYSSTVVERLLEEDAIIIGRANCDEFAMGSTSENSAFGTVKNADDPTKVPGGSSGGSAVAVQADTCLVALGSDTGGSVRQPASFCNLVGVKPTYGLVSRHGLIAYASSFDQIGPLTRNVADAAKILEIIAGKDDFDATCTSKPIPEYSKYLKHEGKMRIAYLKEVMESKGLNEEIKEQVEHCIQQLSEAGHEVEAVDFPFLQQVVPTYYILTTAEASSNLARYDGIRYGYQEEQGTSVEERYRHARSGGFGKEVQRRIMIGTFVLSSGYYDAYYSKAQKVRRLLFEHINEIFQNYDFIVMPTTPTTAFKLGEKGYQDPVSMYLADIFTVQANLVGVPAISLPLFQHSDGMGFGLQLMAKRFNEKELLAFSNYLVQMLEQYQAN